MTRAMATNGAVFAEFDETGEGPVRSRTARTGRAERCQATFPQDANAHRGRHGGADRRCFRRRVRGGCSELLSCYPSVTWS
jgi:hypothetical protein